MSSKSDQLIEGTIMKNRTIFLITGIAALLTLPTKLVPAVSLDELLAKRKPEAIIDLATKAGA